MRKIDVAGQVTNVMPCSTNALTDPAHVHVVLSIMQTYEVRHPASVHARRRRIARTGNGGCAPARPLERVAAASLRSVKCWVRTMAMDAAMLLAVHIGAVTELVRKLRVWRVGLL